MSNFEKMGTDPAEANKQLQGFEIQGTQEELNEAYDGIFEGIETQEFNEMIDEFKEILANAPEDVQEALVQGDVSKIEEKAKSWGWAAKKVKQFIVAALVLSSASTAFAAGGNAREAGLQDAIGSEPIVKSRIVPLKQLLQDPNMRMKIMGQNLNIAPIVAQQNTQDLSHGKFSVNGHSARVVYQDSDRVVYGDENSEYRVEGNSTIATGVIVVE